MVARTGRPSLSKEEIADRKDIVITATLGLISERGISGIRLKDVARAAGISVGTIQYYFDSREDLILSAYQQHSQNVIALVRASFHEGTDPWTSLAQTFHDFFHVADFSTRTRLWIEFVQRQHATKSCGTCSMKSSSPGSRSSDASSKRGSPMGASPPSWMRRSRSMPCWHSLMVSKLPTPLEPSAQTSNASSRFCSRRPASSWAPRESRPTARQAPDRSHTHTPTTSNID
jgi:AcrR family transcriptional regulator